MKHFRIVTDNFSGFEVQRWRWWFPFWIQVGVANTFRSVEQAEEWAAKYRPFKSVVVKMFQTQ